VTPAAGDAPGRLASLAFLGAGATLTAALFLERVAGAVPCPLCLLQRHPYHAALALLGASLVLPAARRRTRPILALCAAVFAVSALMAGHHSLVEAGVLAAPAGCAAGSLPAPGSVEEFNAALRGVRVAACDRVGFRLLGFSLANWNVLASLCLAATCLAGAVPARPRQGPPASA
jgi:disulfide bond formation protein DsbB